MPLLGVGGGWRRLLGTGPGSSGDDPHAVLGVAPGASLDAIKEAYRRCALRWHPDRATDTGNEAANRNFRLATEAFAVLRNGVGGAPSSPGAALNRAGTGTALDNARVGGARGGPGTRLGGRGQGGFRGSGSTVPGSPLTDHEARQIFDEIDAAFGTRRRDTREGSFRPGVTLEGMLSATSPTASAGDTDGNADDTAAK